MEPPRIDAAESPAPGSGSGITPGVEVLASPGDPVADLTSEILQRLHDASPKEHFTLGWLMGMLDKRSFGLIMLMCAVVAVVPGVSIAAGLLLIIMSVQMIEGRPAPAFPDGLAARPLPARHLAAVIRRFLPVLKYLEQIAHPRWPTPHDATKRVVGVAVLILSLAVAFTPLPLSNIPPALAIGLISLAYLEEDGLLLAAGLAAGAAVVTIMVFATWETIGNLARWIGV
jgi:hypothetical protein